MAIWRELPDLSVADANESAEPALQWSAKRSFGPLVKAAARSLVLHNVGGLVIAGEPVDIRVKPSGQSTYSDMDDVASVVSVAARNVLRRRVYYVGVKYTDVTREIELEPVAAVSTRLLVDELGEYITEEGFGM